MFMHSRSCIYLMEDEDTHKKSLELCIADVIDGNNGNGNNSLESSSSIQTMSTYDSMMQTLNDELYNGEIDLLEFEDIDFFKMDCATAMSFDYEMNYTMKQLKHIAGYYGIKTKTRKVDAIQDIVVYETDPANGDAVARRKRLFHYIDTLKSDEYFKSFIIL